MNKKFTFMVAALLAAGALTSVQAKDLAGAAGDGKYYKLLRSAQYKNPNGNSGNWDDITKGTNDMYLVLGADGKLVVSPTMPEDINEALWTVTKGGLPNTYILKNKAGKTLSNNGQSIFYTVNLKTTGNVASIDDAFTINLAPNGQDNLAMENPSNGVYEANWTASELGSYDLAFDLVAAVSTDPAQVIKDLNSTMGGDGFTLVSANKDITVEDANNVFSTQVKAVKIAEFKNLTTGETVPSGTYLVKSSTCPAALTETGFVGVSETKEKMAIFNDCEFVVVSPNESYETTTVNKNGLKMKFVAGSELHKYTESDKASKGSEISVNNAVFTLAEPDSYTNPGQYTITLSEYARVVAKTDGTQAAVGGQGLSIGVTTISGVKYVTTTGENTSFKVGQGSLVKVIDLLKKENAPSIFTMQFLSNDNSEYGKYLGVAKASSFGLVAQGDALVDLALPQYQFVISNIDTDAQTVTFTNIEQDVNAASFTASLYKTEEENVYKVITTSTVSIAKDDQTGYVSGNLNGMIVRLTPVELDAYAGFVKLDVNNNTPYKLAFAKNSVTDNKVYVARAENSTTATTLADESDLQVVFEPVVVNNKVSEMKNEVSYVYNKNDKAYKDSDDMGVYYKYNLRVVDAEKKSYLELSSDKLVIKETETPTTSFVAKYGHDGSISLSSESTSFVTSTTKKITASTSSAVMSSSATIYDAPVVNAVSLYMEAEKLGVSLAAKPVHVSLESENGGFLNVNEANEGVVAIRTEAAEDLTFWLDTTNSEAFIPSFYISKGGKFMYNSTDSLKNGSKQTITTESKAKYGVGENGVNAKAIFKAGKLVNSDTLSTIVEGKEVMIAAKANQNKGILDGIENFQYNIVKASDSGDNYVVRNVDGSAYLTNFNGVLGFIADKENAMRVIVETQAAPTSNESVSASEVKVVANNGSVVVKNAAGKNVVVSTILGQVVANEVLTSDNATINVPAGIVVVAVEGESFKVNVK